ncbi:heparinase II/III family protein [Magnetospirillum sp. UT-4]|uniref:heparinase II/III domain-containing protein n=1 Tax=Magnetospirillum sp. UT-4 TaxID=2681467 RepID=UPI00137EA5D2|nr:heparinase II/III family protein [Magnetospirillum sp. UT-4]CAA7621713.1 Heparinase II/III family protein [Magnetospirillum sp. UT-4]
MFHAVARKGRQLAADPVLRRWLLARALGRTPAEPGFVAHRPAYLGPDWPGLPLEAPTRALPALAAGEPEGPLVLRLPGITPTVPPGGAEAAVAGTFADVETQLALHRFAWVPLMDSGADPRWVGAMWSAWARRHPAPDGSMAWHPYTAAERAVNLLTFAARHGLPEDAAAPLAAHAPAIAAGLEWFGDHHTSNHCANNGRGLYLLGLALGLERATEAGARILLAEGERIFRPSGVLREGSTHYHLLLTRQWASVWLAARTHSRPETDAFGAVLAGAMAVLPHFDLPGRFPLMGDISPDCPPDHLSCLLPGRPMAAGWTGLLAVADRAALAELRDRTPPAASVEGWLRRDIAGWSGLWHGEPEGWSMMPGHGHQDCGAPELHAGGEALFVDAGRGSYAQAGEADPYVGAGVHGGLSVDGADPYPQNRPYYAAEFRAAQAGPAGLEAIPDGVRLVHHGYRRFGLGAVERVWRFREGAMRVDDTVEGRGRHRITRRLVTGAAVAVDGGAAILTQPSGRRWRVAAEDARPALSPLTLWHAYGEGSPGTVLAFETEAVLPWRGTLTVEAL